MIEWRYSVGENVRLTRAQDTQYELARVVPCVARVRMQYPGYGVPLYSVMIDALRYRSFSVWENQLAPIGASDIAKALTQ